MVDTTEPTNENEVDNSQETSQESNDNTSSQSFYEGFSDEDSKYVKDKGWNASEDMLKSYRELEKSYSGKISLPKDGDKESWDNLYTKLGMPEKAEDYQLEGVDESIEADVRNILFKNNVLPKDVNSLVKDYNELIVRQQENLNKQLEENSKKELEEVRTDWGNDADKNCELARRGSQLLDVDEDVLNDIENAMGTKKFMLTMKKLGESISEDNVSFSTDGTKKNSGDMSYAEYYKQLD